MNIIAVHHEAITVKLYSRIRWVKPIVAELRIITYYDTADLSTGQSILLIIRFKKK